MSQIKSLKEIQREHISKVLDSTDWDLERACRVLGISKGDLVERLEEHGLEQPEREKTN